ncbi:MAG: ABC transporter permease, partial [Proteobacteria bacterium]|nr:ABC transporter permease [Pseudomonadota bacterium]
MALPLHATTGERIWHYTFLLICTLIFAFLIIPILIIFPLSFNAQPYFTFTPEMLSLDPAGYTTKWYEKFFSSSTWQAAVRNSISIAIFSTLISTFLGTLAALGLSRKEFPYKTAIMGLLISPMVVPLIISAAGMFFFYSRIGLQGTHIGVILAHAALASP